MVDGIAVLEPGLSVMAGLAERLPVGLVPEQGGVASMWFDVVNDGGLCVSPVSGALCTQRMGTKKRLALPLPT